MSRLKRWLPLVISLSLIAWLVTRISPAQLLEAATRIDWRLLAPATALLVICLYLWDGVCFRYLYSTPTSVPTYRQALHVRGVSYLVGIIHYGLGTTAAAWSMSRVQQTHLLTSLSLSVVLIFHDAFVLLVLGLLGALLNNAPETQPVVVFCGIGTTVMLVLAAIPYLLPQRRQQRLIDTRWGAWLRTWSPGRSLKLCGLRMIYYSILLVYAAVALTICRIPVRPSVIVSTIPLMLLADGLPSVAGLGTRETTLLLLLRPKHPEMLLAMSLFWSVGLLLGRLLIGLAYLWGPRLLATRNLPQSETS